MSEMLNDRIRARAYHIWEREGRPEGRADDHWTLASEEIAIEDNLAGTLKPNPSRGGDDEVVHPEPVEPLQAAEQLGELGEPTIHDGAQPAPRAPRGRRGTRAGEGRSTGETQATGSREPEDRTAEDQMADR